MAFGILGNLGTSQVDMHGPVGYGLRAASFIPGPLGLIGTLGSLGVRSNNAGFADRARPSWGQEGLDIGQAIGGALGLNSYGQGGDTDRLGEYGGVAVAPGGMVSNGGIFGIGATTTGAYTPAEAQRRNAAALYGSSFGTPVQPGAVAQAQPQAPVQSAPAPAAPSPDPASMAPPQAAPAASNGGLDAARNSVFGAANSAVQIGRDAINRALSSGNRGGGGNGDGGSSSSGGGRSDRSSNSSGRG